MREPDSERLEQAVASYRAALSLSSRERNPLEWAATQSNLGSARLEQAPDVVREALEDLTRERVPLD